MQVDQSGDPDAKIAFAENSAETALVGDEEARSPDVQTLLCSYPDIVQTDVDAAGETMALIRAAGAGEPTKRDKAA